MNYNNGIEYIDLKWDTDYFGIPSAKIILNRAINTEDIADIEKFCKNYSFITIFNKGNNENNRLIANLNVYLADVNVEFKKENINYIKNNKDIVIKNNYPYDENIVKLAASEFKYSRFYDIPFLDNDKKKSIYSEWVKNSFNKKGKFFCLYSDGGNTCGFLLYHIENDKIIIELIAVDSKCRGKGIGKSLITALENFAFENDIQSITVGTQLNNIAAQNFYISCGFKHSKNYSIFILRK